LQDGFLQDLLDLQLPLLQDGLLQDLLAELLDLPLQEGFLQDLLDLQLPLLGDLLTDLLDLQLPPLQRDLRLGLQPAFVWAKAVKPLAFSAP
jgi:hypothetical protein